MKNKNTSGGGGGGMAHEDPAHDEVASAAAAAATTMSRGGGSVGPEHLTILVHGPPGVGKSAAVAAAAAVAAPSTRLGGGGGEDPDAEDRYGGGGSGGSGGSLFPHVKVFRADVVAASGGDVEHALRTAFDDAAKASLSLLIVDGLEVLLGVAPGDVAMMPSPPPPPPPPPPDPTLIYFEPSSRSYSGRLLPGDGWRWWQRRARRARVPRWVSRRRFTPPSRCRLYR